MGNFIAIPDYLTLLNLIFGFLAILMAFKLNFELSALFVIIAIIFDSVDGWVARKIGRTGESDFGKNIDSLADAISFGLVPGVLLYILSLQIASEFNIQFLGIYVVEIIGLVVGIFIVVCGILRLTRFNVITDKIDFNGFVGLPIPLHALLFSSFVLAGLLNFNVNSTFNNLTLILWSFLLVLNIFTGILMISTIKYPKLNNFKIIIPLAILIFLLIISFASGGFLIYNINIPGILLFIFSFILIFICPLIQKNQ
jgi:archaetidylserine synthase